MKTVHVESQLSLAFHEEFCARAQKLLQCSQRAGQISVRYIAEKNTCSAIDFHQKMKVKVSFVMDLNRAPEQQNDQGCAH